MPHSALLWGVWSRVGCGRPSNHARKHAGTAMTAHKIRPHCCWHSEFKDGGCKLLMAVTKTSPEVMAASLNSNHSSHNSLHKHNQRAHDVDATLILCL